MKFRPKSAPQTRPQPTSEALRNDLLDFLQRKFYQGHPVAFAKDRKRLLDWVVLWPAKWLNERGITLPGDRYREIFMAVFMDGLRFGNTGNITYLPAWLAKVIQSHFDHHGEEIYDRAKSIRSLADHVMHSLGRLTPHAPDPVRHLAAAARLLKPRKAPPKRPLNLTPELGL